MTAAGAYPVHVRATLDPRLSRWLWLVKWLLVIPHYVVLFFLWIGFAGSSVVAFFAILVTGRYPRVLFDYNVGVLRWSWRVSYYAYGALGTDRYPPFSLADDPDYPAHFDVDHPEHLSRGLVLVKWWLLAIPHYLVVGIFVGGGTWALDRSSESIGGSLGLIGLLVLFAALALAFTGRYPRQIFGFVLGMDRWALRVAAYAALMTDVYPPFRLDLGGDEATTADVAVPAAPAAPQTPPARPGWTAGRVVTLLVGLVLGAGALGLLAGGGVATWATTAGRDDTGYVTSTTRTFATPAVAITSDDVDLSGFTGDVTPSDLLGTVRLRATSTAPGRAVFIGIAPRSTVDAYLGGADRAVVTDWVEGATRTRGAGGAPPALAPTAAPIWTATVSGTGTQTLDWRPTAGHWTVVVMNADGLPGVAVRADVGASLPDLGWLATGLLAAGALLLVAAAVAVVVPVSRASRPAPAAGAAPAPARPPGGG